MLQVHTKLTSQGQVSVPSAIRSLLGLTPGAMIEWTQVGDQVVVTRSIRHNTSAVHRALFPQAPGDSPALPPVATPVESKTLSELKSGIRQHMQRRHARS